MGALLALLWGHRMLSVFKSIKLPGKSTDFFSFFFLQNLITRKPSIIRFCVC